MGGTVYYVCDSCAHVQPHPADVDEASTGCENCANWSMSGPFVELAMAEEISQVRLDAREPTHAEVVRERRYEEQRARDAQVMRDGADEPRGF